MAEDVTQLCQWCEATKVQYIQATEAEALRRSLDVNWCRGCPIFGED